MGDVAFNDPLLPDRSGLLIDGLLYQSRPMHGVDGMLRALLREWRAFLFAFLVIMLLGMLYIVIAPRQYLAEATVMAAPRQADLSRTDSVLNGTTTPEPVIVRDPDIEGEMQLMISPASLRHVVQKLGLDKLDPNQRRERMPLSELIQSLRVSVGLEKQPAAGATPVPEFGQALLAFLGFGPQEGNAAPVDPARRVSLAAEELNRKLTVAPIGRSTMIRIQYAARDPKLAADVASAIAANYIDARYHERADAAADAGAWLRLHTEELHKQLVDSEARLAAFRAKSVVNGLDATQIQNEIKVLSEAIVVAKTKQDLADSHYAIAEDRVRRDGPMALLNWETDHAGPDEYLAQERAISEMRREATKLMAVQGPFATNATHLEAEAKNLEHQLLIEAQNKFTNLKMSADAAARQVASLEAQLASLRKDYDKLDASQVQLSSYERAVAAARTVYENFVTRTDVTEQAGFNVAQGWLVSPGTASPLPSKPNIPLVLFGSLVAAIGAGFSNAMYREYRGRQTIRSSEDVERYLPGVRSLGLLPELSRRPRRVRDVVMTALRGSDPFFNEAAKNFYASLTMATAQDRHDGRGSVLMVSSALPIEGKSTTAALIALLASAAGRRVIIVDCDLRKPTMHEALGVERKPGLMACIEGGIPLGDAIRQDKQTGVWIMPAGVGHDAPQQALASPRFANAISALRAEFDLVVIDTPPILGLSDARLLTRHADHTLLTVCWSRTTGKAARLALRMIAEYGSPIAGVVVTRADVKRLAAMEVPEAEPYRARNRSYYNEYYNAAKAIRAVDVSKLAGPSA